jgi:RHS repeat-associated protein
MVIKMVQGDNDEHASSVPAGARATYYLYGDSDFPGKVTEVRRLSQVKSGASNCNATTTTDCKRTIYSYTSGGLLDTVQEKGWTLTSSGSQTTYDFTTDYDYDGYGRLTKINGPRASTDDDIEFTYHGGSDLDTNYLYEVKRKKGVSTYITTTYNAYNYWGRAERITDPNSKSVCLDYHDQYGRLASRRVVINGSHTDCGSAGGNDETTSYTFDTHRRVTKITKPRLNCRTFDYDSEGRLATISEMDSLAASFRSPLSIPTPMTDKSRRSNGRTQPARQRSVRNIHSMPTGASRRSLTRSLPVTTRSGTTTIYSSSDAKTEWDVDDLNRNTKIRRYTGESDNEEWSLTQAAQHMGLPTEVIDESSKDIDYVWDDLGRKVKQETEENGITYLVYDEAGNLATKVEADGLADEQTTTYTYDTLNRLTDVDTGDSDCFANGREEIQYMYDALSGVSCPGSSNCDLLSGRLAYVKVVLWCDDSESDDTFDQETFYSYDEAGRIEEHTVQDDSSRVGRVTYTYDDNSNITHIQPPAGSGSTAIYDYTASTSSTDDQPTLMKRDTTQILHSIRWLPSGSLSFYRQENVISSDYVEVTFNRNLAYRLTDIDAEASHTTLLKVDHAEDVRGRYTERVFTGDSGSPRDMYFLYDDLSRVTCRRTTSGSTCPTSGRSLGENISYTTTSGDRSTLYLRNRTYTDQQFTLAYDTGTSDELDKYTKVGTNCGGPACIIDYAHDTLGRRTSDDDNEWGGGTNHDQRTYTYDGRNNLITVSGVYYISSSWNDYTITYAYDERNRIIFKSFYDEDDHEEAQWFFYWDQFDRLIQAKHTPDIDTSSILWYWLENRPFLYYQIDYRAEARTITTRRYLNGDEQGRPLAAWSWPSSGNATRVWEVDPGLFGWDEVTVGPDIYQPIRFPGQLYDEDTEAFKDDSGAVLVRPGICYNRYRSYDSFTGTYLQVDPLVGTTWNAYVYGEQSPIIHIDPSGLELVPPGWDSTWSLSREAYKHGLGVQTLPPPFGVARPVPESRSRCLGRMRKLA